MQCLCVWLKIVIQVMKCNLRKEMGVVNCQGMALGAPSIGLVFVGMSGVPISKYSVLSTQLTFPCVFWVCGVPFSRTISKRPHVWSVANDLFR